MMCNSRPMASPHPDPHPASESLAYASIAELQQQLAQGTLTVAALAQTLRDRIAAVEAAPYALRAVIDVDNAATGGESGPLSGIPFLVKDNYEVTGWASAAGSLVFSAPATQDAVVVATLRAAGAVPIASTNMSEWASASSSELEPGFSPRGGLTGNPFALDRSAGESSSGSAAAVAAGLAPFALGTETIGSLTMPASRCGVFAFKPTRGALSTQGIAPYSPKQDVPGLFARSLEDLRTVAEVLLARELGEEPAPQLTFIEDNDLYDPEQSSRALATAYDQAVMTMVDRGAFTQALPTFPLEAFNAMMHVLYLELRSGLNDYFATRPGTLVRNIEELVQWPVQHGDFTYTNDHFAEAASLGKAPVSRSVGERAFVALFDQALDGGDVLIAPAYGPAEKLDLARRGRRPTLGYQSYLDGLSSFAGWPTLTMPFMQDGGLPVGMVLVARPHCEAQLFAAALVLIDAGVAGQLVRPTWQLPQRG